MSLINDALRRTSQSQSPPAIPAETPPLRPTDAAPRQMNLALMLGPVIILLLGLAGWFWIKWWESSTRAGQPASVTRVAAREVSQPIVESAPVSPVAAAREELSPREGAGFPASRPNFRPGPPLDPPSRAGLPLRPVASAPGEPPTLPAPATNGTETTAVEPVRLALPTFKLQGIFYRPANPSAVINAKVVYVGDKVEQARVLAIEKDEVTIEYKGQKSVLSLQ